MEKVVQVPAVARERGHALAEPAEYGQEEVQDRQTCKDYGQEQMGANRVVDSIKVQTQKSEKETKHRAS
jgi:hypothetical protein